MVLPDWADAFANALTQRLPALSKAKLSAPGMETVAAGVALFDLKLLES
jgi:hypothetical protein